MEARKQIIIDHERKIAHEVALSVLDKPKPPLWMIFIPVFFVFFAQKMGQYKSGLKDFAENYLKMRYRALDACLEFRETEQDMRIEKLLSFAGPIPEQSRDSFRQWMHLLTGHYDTLLQARGQDISAMICSGYKSKMNYLLFCNSLNKAENAYNMALLPGIPGDQTDVLHIIKKMNAAVTDIRRRESDNIFR